MIRFITWLLGDKSDKPCKTCQALKEQLDYERAVNREMLETLTSLLKPVPIIQSSTQTPQQIGPKGILWSRRRAELEKQDRERMRVQANSPVIGKPDAETEAVKTTEAINQLEFELGVVEASD
jgi:hypothetical protein